MKKITKFIFGSALAIGVVGLTSCGSGNVEELTKNVISSVSVDDSGNLIISYADGSKDNLGKVTGAQGQAGLGISKTEINDKNELVITFTDGTTQNLGVIVADSGNTVLSIVKTEINDQNELVITYSDGTTQNLGVIVGAPGSDYVKANYTITLVNGDEILSATVEEGNTPTLPTASKEGYEFLGWYTAGGLQVTSLTGIFSDLTLYAQFKEIKEEAITYTISINGKEYVANEEDTLYDVMGVDGTAYYELAPYNYYYINPYTTKVCDLDFNEKYYYSSLNESFMVSRDNMIITTMLMQIYDIECSTKEETAAIYGILSYYVLEGMNSNLYDKITTSWNCNSYREYLSNTEKNVAAIADTIYPDVFYFVSNHVDYDDLKPRYTKKGIAETVNMYEQYIPLGERASILTDESIEYLKKYFETNIDLDNPSIQDMVLLYTKNEDYATIWKNLKITDEAKASIRAIFDSYESYYDFLEYYPQGFYVGDIGLENAFYMVRNRYFDSLEFNTLFDAMKSVDCMCQITAFYAYYMNEFLPGINEKIDEDLDYYLGDYQNVYNELLSESLISFFDKLVESDVYEYSLNRKHDGFFTIMQGLYYILDENYVSMLEEYLYYDIDITYPNTYLDKFEEYLNGLGVGAKYYLTHVFDEFLEYENQESNDSYFDPSYEHISSYFTAYNNRIDNYLEQLYENIAFRYTSNNSSIYTYDETYGVYVEFYKDEDDSKYYYDDDFRIRCYGDILEVDLKNKTFKEIEKKEANGDYSIVLDLETLDSIGKTYGSLEVLDWAIVKQKYSREYVFYEAEYTNIMDKEGKLTALRVDYFFYGIYLYGTYGSYTHENYNVELVEGEDGVSYILPNPNIWNNVTAKVAEESETAQKDVNDLVAVANANGMYDLYYISSKIVYFIRTYEYYELAEYIYNFSMVDELLYGTYNEDYEIVISKPTANYSAFASYYAKYKDTKFSAEKLDHCPNLIYAQDSVTGLIIEFERKTDEGDNYYYEVNHYRTELPYRADICYIDYENKALDYYLPYRKYMINFDSAKEISHQVYVSLGNGVYAHYSLDDGKYVYNYIDKYPSNDFCTQIELDLEKKSFKVVKLSLEAQMNAKYDDTYELAEEAACETIIIEIDDNYYCFNSSENGYLFDCLFFTSDYESMVANGYCFGEFTKDGKILITKHSDDEVLDSIYNKVFETSMVCPVVYVDVSMDCSEYYQNTVFSYKLDDGSYVLEEKLEEFPEDDICIAKLDKEKNTLVLVCHSEEHYEEVYYKSNKEASVSCEYLVGMDEDEDVYILYKYDGENCVYTFDSYITEDDVEDYCYGDFNDDFTEIVNVKHTVAHSIDLKYDISITSSCTCSKVAVYDDNYKLYIYYIFNSENGYVYNGYGATATNYCLGTLTDHTLTVETHLLSEVLDNLPKTLTSAVSYSNLYVALEGYDCYVQYDYDSDKEEYNLHLKDGNPSACSGSIHSLAETSATIENGVLVVDKISMYDTYKGKSYTLSNPPKDDYGTVLCTYVYFYDEDYKAYACFKGTYSSETNKITYKFLDYSADPVDVSNTTVELKDNEFTILAYSFNDFYQYYHYIDIDENCETVSVPWTGYYSKSTNYIGYAYDSTSGKYKRNGFGARPSESCLYSFDENGNLVAKEHNTTSHSKHIDNTSYSITNSSYIVPWVEAYDSVTKEYYQFYYNSSKECYTNVGTSTTSKSLLPVTMGYNTLKYSDDFGSALETITTGKYVAANTGHNFSKGSDVVLIHGYYVRLDSYSLSSEYVPMELRKSGNTVSATKSIEAFSDYGITPDFCVFEITDETVTIGEAEYTLLVETEPYESCLLPQLGAAFLKEITDNNTQINGHYAKKESGSVYYVYKYYTKNDTQYKLYYKITQVGDWSVFDLSNYNFEYVDYKDIPADTTIYYLKDYENNLLLIDPAEGYIEVKSAE